MSDDFIPVNQSTPNTKRWQGQGKYNNYNQNQRLSLNGYQNNRQNRGRDRGWRGNRRGNHSWSSSYGSDNNSSRQDRNPIDNYINPSMLEDPWARLRGRNIEAMHHSNNYDEQNAE